MDLGVFPSVAGAAALGAVALLFIILAFDAIIGAFQAWSGRCGLTRFVIFPDMCLGGCPPSALNQRQACVTTQTRRYFGFLGRQAAACACVVPPPPDGGNDEPDGNDDDSNN